MSYTVNLGPWGSVFAVPTSVVDNGLKLASDNQIKVLLYVLRHNTAPLTDENISQALGIHSEDVRDAIEYWNAKGLFATAQSVVLPAVTDKQDTAAKVTANNDSETDRTAKEPELSTVTQKQEQSATRLVSRPTKPEPAYVARRKNTDKNISVLMDEAESILGRFLSQPDMATILMLHDTDGLPPEVILMLMQHCVQIGNGNMRYIEKTGINWAAAGINTISLAEEKIKSYSESTSAWNTAAAVFGMKISGTPTQKQLEFADNWINKWRFSEAMLRLAYERCVDAKGEVKLSYINGILKRWNELSFKKTEDVLANESKATAKRKPAPPKDVQSASYDIDAYESKSIFDD